jgi:hypothetical protein
MKAQTRIRLAVKLERDVYADYARIVDHVPVIPKNPQVMWRSGLGWYIDGKRVRGTADEIINDCQGRVDACAQAINDFRAGRLERARTVATPDEVNP